MKYLQALLDYLPYLILGLLVLVGLCVTFSKGTENYGYYKGYGLNAKWNNKGYINLLWFLGGLIYFFVLFVCSRVYFNWT